MGDVQAAAGTSQTHHGASITAPVCLSTWLSMAAMLEHTNVNPIAASTMAMASTDAPPSSTLLFPPTCLLLGFQVRGFQIRPNRF